MTTILQRTAALAAIALALLAAVPAAAADANEAKVAEIKRRMDAMVEGHAKAIVAEQPDDKHAADASLILGAFYEMGMIGDKDSVRAAHFFQFAYERGSAEAACSLGNIFSAGATGPSGRLERDMPKALAYYERAATEGSVKAMLELAYIYTEGVNGVPPDAKKALNHLRSAAAHGDETALKRLEPVMQKAAEWERDHPGKPANFPTTREQLVSPALVEKERARNLQLDKMATDIHQDINRRITKSMKTDIEREAGGR